MSDACLLGSPSLSWIITARVFNGTCAGFELFVECFVKVSRGREDRAQSFELQSVDLQSFELQSF